jgi:peptidoglycan/LPS O-acetylase OafA/YrhL
MSTPTVPGSDGAVYRSEIDGLRAIAVIAVIVNHFDDRLLPSGYLGVDIFFVISGYVITGSLAARPASSLRELLAGFYARRIRRLVPALIFCVLVTSFLSCLVSEFPGVALKTGATSLFGGSNVFLMVRATDYFATATELNTFTHTWSLGVEEQFYLGFPLLVWLTGYGKLANRSTQRLVILLGVLIVVTCAAFVYLNGRHQPIAFFSMPTRLWELAAGCLMFVSVRRIGRPSGLVGAASTLVLVGLVATLWFPLSLAVPSTVLAVVLTALLLVLLAPGSPSYAILSNRVVVYVGLISYPLYLWHWSVLSVSRFTIGIDWWTIPIQVLLMLVASVLSYRYLELPLRRRKTWSLRWGTIRPGIAALAITALVVVGLGFVNRGIYLGGTSPSQLWTGNGTPLTEENCNAKNPWSANYQSRCFLASRTGQTAMAVGDSQTGHLIPLLSKLSVHEGLGIRFYSDSGHAVPSVPEVRSTGGTLDGWFKDQARMDKFIDEQLGSLGAGDLLILSSRWELRWTPYPLPKEQRTLTIRFFDEQRERITKAAALGEFERQFDALAKRMAKSRINVVVFTPIPVFENYVPPAVIKPEWFNGPVVDAMPRLERRFLLSHYAELNAALQRVRSRNSNVYVFDAFSVICPPTLQECVPRRDGLLWYRDQWHLSNDGSNALADALVTYLRDQRLLKAR